MEEKVKITIRMQEKSRDKLKVISAFEKRPMGDILDELIDQRYARHDQGRKPEKKNHDKKKRGF